MAKKESGRGRPKAANPKKTLVSFRIDSAIETALTTYRDKLNVTDLSLSDAARDLVVKALKREGLA